VKTLIEELGRKGLAIIHGCGFSLDLLWKVTRRAVHPNHPRRELHSLVAQMYQHGVKAIPVVLLAAFFTGMIVSLQTGIELRDFGAQDRIGTIVAASMFREMGPFITAIILTATAGAACAAEIGTMRVSEEVDALDMMSIDPVRFLVMPRVLAIGIMGVLLTVLTDVCATIGGAFVAQNNLGVSAGAYFRGARDTLAGDYLLGVLALDVYSGLVKAFVFGILIGVVGCACGLLARGGALGVGDAVRRSVVSSIVLVLILGYYLTWAFYG
jgi:phospholipid/cholesterol/gamma-HCH transport system permease protein